jgi:hypothetical protein
VRFIRATPVWIIKALDLNTPRLIDQKGSGRK